MSTNSLLNKTFEIVRGMVDLDEKRIILRATTETDETVVIYIENPERDLLNSLKGSNFKGSISQIQGKAGISEGGKSVILATSFSHTAQEAKRPFYKNPAHKTSNHAQPRRG